MISESITFSEFITRQQESSDQFARYWKGLQIDKRILTKTISFVDALALIHFLDTLILLHPTNTAQVQKMLERNINNTGQMQTATRRRKRLT